MEFLPFFLVLLVGALSSMAFRSFHLPWVLALILAGVIIGPFGLELVEINPTIAFIGEVGLIFLMFMAGLETKLSTFRSFNMRMATLPLLSATIPFAAGYGVGFFFSFGVLPSLLLGIIFMSSSIAVAIPTLEARDIIHKKLGRTIVATTIIVDVASLLLLSIVLQTANQITALPLPSFYLLLAVLVAAFAYGLPKIRNLFPHRRDERDLFESEVRIVLVLLLGTVVVFELLGLHPIVAGFFAGLVLSDSIKSEILIEKLRTVSYGIFIPVFFVVIGMETDITVFSHGTQELGLVLAIVVSSMIAKLTSGWIGGKINGFSNRGSLTIGFATIPQLSTSLAVVYTAIELDLLESNLATAMVVLSVITTLIAPIGVNALVEQETESSS